MYICFKFQVTGFRLIWFIDHITPSLREGWGGSLYLVVPLTTRRVRTTFFSTLSIGVCPST